MQDRSALSAAGIAARGAEAALRIGLQRSGKGRLAELQLDRLDLHFANRNTAPAIFDAVFGALVGMTGRADGKGQPSPLPQPEMIGIADGEALMPRTRESFEGYRLLREYFVMPERFHFARVDGLAPLVRQSETSIELVFLFRRPAPELADLAPADFALFATPIVNLFERDCNVIELDPRKTRQVVYVDRTRPRDFEIYRVTHVEDADATGPDAVIPALFDMRHAGADGWVYSVERRPRRAAEDERRKGMTRTSYTGDDVFLALSRPAGMTSGRSLKRIEVTALCTNRDLPILDDAPDSDLESGDPVEEIRLIGALHPPQPAMAASLPAGAEGESRADELAWRLVSQLSLNFLSLADEGRGADPLHAVLDLYADRGDPSLARHVRSIVRLESRGRRRKAADRRADVLRPRHRDHAARRPVGASRPERPAPLGAARPALRPLCRHQRLRTDPYAALAASGGCVMADDARQSLPDLGGPAAPLSTGLDFFELLRQLERGEAAASAMPGGRSASRRGSASTFAWRSPSTTS